MLYKKARIVKINNKKDLEKYTLNYSQGIKVPGEVTSGGFLIFIRMPYKEYDTEKLVNDLISDSYKLFVARNTRLIFNDPLTLMIKSAFIYVSEKFLIT